MLSVLEFIGLLFGTYGSLILVIPDFFENMCGAVCCKKVCCWKRYGPQEQETDKEHNEKFVVDDD